MVRVQVVNKILRKIRLGGYDKDDAFDTLAYERADPVDNVLVEMVSALGIVPLPAQVNLSPGSYRLAEYLPEKSVALLQDDKKCERVPAPLALPSSSGRSQESDLVKK